jgi:hypothetical protein
MPTAALAGTFPNHLASIRDGKYNPKNKTFHSFDDIIMAKDRAVIENIIPELIRILGIVYKNFEKRDFYNAFLRNIALSLLNTVSNECQDSGGAKRAFYFRI